MFTMKIVVCGDPIDVTQTKGERGMATTLKGDGVGAVDGEKERGREEGERERR